MGPNLEKRNNITIRGQYMYPREAPTRLVALLRAELLPLAELEVTSFTLEQVNEAVTSAAAMVGPFRHTVIAPAKNQH